MTLGQSADRTALAMSSRKSLFRTFYKLHVYLGIFVAVHFAVFALTGLVLLFKDELQGETKEAVVLADKGEIANAYALILKEIQKEYPNDRVLALFPDDTNANIINARVGIDGSTKLRGARRLSFNMLQNVQTHEEAAGESKVFEWLLALHREMFLGSVGKIYVGFVGLAYVFMLISGFFIYGNFMKGRSFGEIRSGKIFRLTDLHKFIGMLSFGWGLIVGMSGVFLAFNGLLIKLFLYGSLAHLSEQYRDHRSETAADAPFVEVVKSALNAKSDAVISYISFPDTEFGIPGHYLFLVNGTDRFSERLSDLLVINAKTAALTEIVELPLYLKLVLLSEPLHFGDYGGIFLKVLWAVFSLCSLAVAGLGLVSFFLKRRKRRETEQRSENRKPRNLELPISLPGYGAPVFCGVFSLTGIVGTLFAEGVVAKVALGALLIPLIVLVTVRRRRNV